MAETVAITPYCPDMHYQIDYFIHIHLYFMILHHFALLLNGLWYTRTQTIKGFWAATTAAFAKHKVRHFRCCIFGERIQFIYISCQFGTFPYKLCIVTHAQTHTQSEAHTLTQPAGSTQTLRLKLNLMFYLPYMQKEQGTNLDYRLLSLVYSCYILLFHSDELTCCWSPFYSTRRHPPSSLKLN